MAFDFSKLANMRHETFVVEVTVRQKRLLDGIMYPMGLTSRERAEGRALWDRIKHEWNCAADAMRPQGVSLSSYEIKLKLHPVPMLYGDDDGWPIVIDEMTDDDGVPHHEADPGDKYNTPEAIINAMNERADFTLWKRRKDLPQAVPGVWRGVPLKDLLP